MALRGEWRRYHNCTVRCGRDCRRLEAAIILSLGPGLSAATDRRQEGRKGAGLCVTCGCC